MNILFVSEHYKPAIQGGGEINHFLVCEALVRLGHHVVVLTSKAFGRSDVETIEGVIVYRRLATGSVDSFTGNLKRMFHFRKCVVREVKKLAHDYHFDIVHLIGSSLEAAEQLKEISNKVGKIPVIATVESYVPLCPKGDFMCGGSAYLQRWGFFTFVRCLIRSTEIGKLRNRWYLAYNPVFWAIVMMRFRRLHRSLKYAHLLSISSFVHDLAKRLTGLESTVIPNFFDSSFTPRRQFQKRKIPIIVYLGSLTQYKGPHVLLNAVKPLKCRVHFYGRGPMKDHLITSIKKNHLNAELFDPVDYEHLAGAYEHADVVVFPSLWPEPFGRIALEAQAIGTPVIASDIGAIPEIVYDKNLLFRAGDAADLRRALDYVLQKSQKTAEARTFVERLYSERVVIGRLLSVYERALGTT